MDIYASADGRLSAYMVFFIIYNVSVHRWYNVVEKSLSSQFYQAPRQWVTSDSFYIFIFQFSYLLKRKLASCYEQIIPDNTNLTLVS